MYNCITLLYSRNSHNIINQLYFNKINFKNVPVYLEKTLIREDTCTSMFTAALFTIGKPWKPPKRPSTHEWIKQMWHIYTMEYYSAIKRDEIELFVVRWIDLESVIQSEVSQKEKNKYRMLTHIYRI